MSGFSFTVIGQWGAYPGPGEATSCYLLRSGGTSVLLDCGSGALSVMQEMISADALSAVVLSHYHADHVADLGCLQYAARIGMDLGRRSSPLVVYGHADSTEARKLGYLEFAEGRNYDRDAVVVIGPFEFRFAPMVHPDPSYAMRVSSAGISIVYSGDTGANQGLVDFARGADLLICETSLYDEYRGRIPGHMCASEAGETARQAGVAALMISHLPHFGAHETLLAQAGKAFGGKTILASRKLTLEFGEGSGKGS